MSDSDPTTTETKANSESAMNSSSPTSTAAPVEQASPAISNPNHQKLKSIALAKDARFPESWLQELIADDPELLGLGELRLLSRERRQRSRGRLDLLLASESGDEWFEVEIQLGATDESHLIRTIEYWDLERRRYPRIEHTAVIVAEEITTRFLNVIHLFNGHIPLIALKLTAYEIGNDIAVTFTRVLDKIELGTPDETQFEDSATADETYWIEKIGRERFGAVTKLFEPVITMASERGENASIHHTRGYLGTKLGLTPKNFFVVEPQKRNLATLRFRIEESAENDERVSDLCDRPGLEMVKYDSTFGYYRVRVTKEVNESVCEVVRKLAARAYEALQ